MEYKITALEAQKKNPNRMNVYLDGEFAFGVSKIVAVWLTVDQTISDEKIAALKEKDAYEVAFQKAVHYLSYRSRSEKEVRDKLASIDTSESTIDAVATRLIDLNMLGDADFARAWVENRTAFRPRSRRLLSLELRRKGVPDYVISEVLESAEDEDSLAYQAALKYSRKVEGLEWQEFRKKLTGFLGRRGFSYEVVNSVVRRIWAEKGLESSTSLNRERG